MGSKLKSQIAGILFLLFAMSVIVVSYFNLSILFEAMRALSEEQSSAFASNIVSWFEKSIPEDGYSEEYVKLRIAQRGDLEEQLRDVRGLRTFKITDGEGRVIYTYGPVQANYPNHRAGVRDALAAGKPVSRLWEYDTEKDLEGHPLDGRSMLLPRLLSFEYFRPVMADGRPVAAYHLSLQVQEMPRRLRIMLLGNILLAFIFLLTAFVAINVWTANAINRPLEFLLQAQDKIGRGDFTARVNLDLPSTNEIVSISASFNRMAADLRRFRKELEIKTVRLEELNQEYRRLNETLESEVEEKTRELKDFFGVVTHDLKVPLAAIQGYVDLLLRAKADPLTDKQARHLHTIAAACSQLLALTRNMMESVKYDAGKINYFMEDFDLADLVEEVRQQLRQAVDEKRIAATVEVPPLCRNVRGDRSKIAQVFSNLLNNSVKFTPIGGKISLRARDRGSHVEVTVTDNGTGISPDQLPHLFEKFTQFHTVEGATSGIGLGLYIVGKILEGHGQTIRVESVLDEGSTFTFTLAKGTRGARAESLEVLAGEGGG